MIIDSQTKHLEKIINLFDLFEKKKKNVFPNQLKFQAKQSLDMRALGRLSACMSVQSSTVILPLLFTMNGPPHKHKF